MRVLDSDEDALLNALYDVGTDGPLWSTFLDRLRSHVGASYADIDFRPPDRPAGDPVILCSGAIPSAEMRRLYRQEFYKRDPVPYHQLREGRAYTLAELLDISDHRDHQYFADFLAPMGWNWVRMIRFTEPGGVSAWLSIVRDQRDFSAGTSALLEAMCPHLRRALSSYLAIERERFRANVTAGAMQRLNFGWFGIDADGRITGANDRAELLLAQSSYLRRDGHGRLYAPQPAVHLQLCEAIETCAQNRSTRPRAIQISADPWVELLIVPVEDRPASASAVPVAIAYIQDARHASADNHEQISELFGLTTSEARLALAMSRGMSIAQAASALGFTLETTRTYSKKIYAKTGTRGQADLIRLMLGGVLALA